MKKFYLAKYNFLLGISRWAYKLFQATNYGAYTARRKATKE